MQKIAMYDVKIATNVCEKALVGEIRAFLFCVGDLNCFIENYVSLK